MAVMTVVVKATGLDIFTQLAQIIKDVTDDERVPASVREEVMDKVNSILDSKDEE
ncbi:hypothetical protein [Bacillus sp. ISL-46]|uniref:hypothetical protein n=1 Tax=Bacillus sp. ISL-46 TaxID=2819129 RepID=UPI001BE87B29|nr:hypothetical protein [Bacillus sp. ISL-46]MBT2722303.1 hypothetical protein [Bacillus sp. ISL-46]